MFANVWKKWRWWLRKDGGRVRKPLKSIMRFGHLELETLEPRWLFNTAVFLPRRSVPLEGVNQISLNNWFSPVGGDLSPQFGLGDGPVSATLSLAGSFTLNTAATYTLTLNIAGGTAPTTFSFTETASVTVTLYEGGSNANGSLSVSSYSLAQTAVASWTYQEWTPVELLSGNGTYTTLDTSPGFTDSFHWYGFDWYDSVACISKANNLGLPSMAWNSFTLNQTGTYSQFTYQEWGTTTLTESRSYSATSPAGSNGSGGSHGGGGGTHGGSGDTSDITIGETLALAQYGNYTYTEDGNGTFNLFEQGSYANASFNLSSVFYNEASTITSSTYQQTGTESLSGSYTESASDTAIEGLTTLTNSSGSAYNFQELDTYNYSESDTGSYALAESGNYATSAFNLSSVVLNRLGAGLYSYQESGFETLSSGTGNSGSSTTADQCYGLNGNATVQNSDNQSYTFTGTESHTYAENGSGTFSDYEAGSFARGSYSLSSYALSATATASSSSLSTLAQSNTGTGLVWASDWGVEVFTELDVTQSANTCYNSSQPYNFGESLSCVTAKRHRHL